jgi:putative (di)nucleoside polyphosphate hydrolase
MKMKTYRKAVGAVIFKDDKFLLVQKIRAGKYAIRPRWDFSKGGIDKKDKDMKKALFRELYEETGSRKYKIIKQFKDKTKIIWTKLYQKRLGFAGQETTMFLVEYVGNGKDLKPDKYEIRNIKFFTRKETLKRLRGKETIHFFRKNVL